MYHQFNIQQLYVLPIQCIYVFCVDLRTNSHYFPIQHQLTGFYNRNGECLLRGTDWVFKQISDSASSVRKINDIADRPNWVTQCISSIWQSTSSPTHLNTTVSPSVSLLLNLKVCPWWALQCHCVPSEDSGLFAAVSCCVRRRPTDCRQSFISWTWLASVQDRTVTVKQSTYNYRFRAWNIWI